MTTKTASTKQPGRDAVHIHVTPNPAPKPSKGTVKLNSRTSAAASRVGRKQEAPKMALTSTQAAAEALDDEIEVRDADGNVKGRLPQESRGTTAVPKNGKAPKPTKGEVAQESRLEVQRLAKEAAQATKQAQKDKDKLAKDRAKLIADKAKLAQEVKDKKAQDKKDKADKLAAAKQVRADEREAAKQERRAAKDREVGMTGDEATDTQYRAALETAHSMALVPTNTKELGLDMSIFSYPGVKLDGMGLTLPENMPIGDWLNLTGKLATITNAGAWATGDALKYGTDAYGKMYDRVVGELGLKEQTLKNYKSVATTFSRDQRVQGASFGHHMEVASLMGTNPAQALNLLQQAVAGGRPASWVREQVQTLRNPNGTVNGTTTAAKRTQDAIWDNLANATEEQREQDNDKYSDDPDQLVYAARADMQAVVNRSQSDELVPSIAVVRVLARTNATITSLEQEVAHWKARAEAAEGILARRNAANASIIGEVTSPASSGDLDFLGDLDDEDEAPEPTAEELEDEDDDEDDGATLTLAQRDAEADDEGSI